LEQLSLPLPSIISQEKFTIENIKELENFFINNKSFEFIQKVIDDKVKFDTNSMIYMMAQCSKKRKQKNIIKVAQEGKEYFVIGDIHADAISLNTILKKTLFYENYENKKLILLGDYVDRGKNRLNVINLLIYLEFLIPENIVILKGNHELFVRDENNKIQSPMQGRESLSYFFTFLNMLAINEQYKEIFTNDFIESYAFYFENLPILALFNFENIKILAVHGGVPRADLGITNYYENFKNLDEFFIENKQDTIGMSLKNNFLWSDPYSGHKDGFRNSSKIRFSFNQDQFVSFCKQFDVDLLLRAHEAQDDGYKIYFENRLISVFSTGGKDIKGNINQNSKYTSVTPNILKIDTQNKAIKSYEILFNDEDMICEKEILFDDILESKDRQEKEYVEYNGFMKEERKTSIIKPKKMIIKDRYNPFSSMVVSLENQKEFHFQYTEDTNKFYGIHKDLNFTINIDKNIIINNCDIKIYIDRFILNKGEKLPLTQGEYRFESGAVLIFEFIED